MSNNIDYHECRRIAFAFGRTRFFLARAESVIKILDKNGKEHQCGNSEVAPPGEFDILLLELAYDRLFRLFWDGGCEKGWER